MDNHRLSSELIEYWEEVCKNWDAVARATYYHKIFAPLMDSVYEIENNNSELENYASACLMECTRTGDEK